MRLVFIGIMLGLLTQDAFAAPYRRVAVVVGANAGSPGRKPLRYAHKDADNVAAVLRMSGVPATDIHVLRDPGPMTVLETLDNVLQSLSHSKEESILFFYYSGHADAQALYPNGKALALNDLRTRLESASATVRIGIIDACRGGGWTGTKGLSQAALFSLNVPLQLSNEGSVLISSSSGLEEAHESELLQGSFFTHHWNAALRGAGDEDQNGTVTLVEAFAYAKNLTIRDTALHTVTPQHPSFQLNLRGRRDLELVNLLAGDSVLTVDQKNGPLQLIHLETGLIVLEIPRGKRQLRLTVPSGRYLVRRREGNRTSAREIQVRVGATTQISEEDLELVGTNQLVAKSFRALPVLQSTLPAGTWDAQVALGVRHGLYQGSGFDLPSFDSGPGMDGTFRVTRGITDRLQWVVPTLGFAYRAGTAGHREWIPWGGLIGWGPGYSSIEGFVFAGTLGLGADGRVWLSPQSSLNLSIGMVSKFQYSTRATRCRDSVPDCEDDERISWRNPSTWKGQATVGYSRTLGDSVTLNAGIGVSQNLLFRGSLPDFRSRNRTLNPAIDVGSIQNRALRSLPLIQLHLSKGFTLDGHVVVSYNLAAAEFADTYLLGGTWTW